MTEAQAHTDQRIDTLVEMQIRAEERQAAFDQRQARTEEQMNTMAMALTDLAHALTTTNKRVEALESNGSELH